MAIGDINVFEHFTLQSLILAFKGVIRQNALADRLGISPVRVYYMITDKPHLIYQDLKGWKKALKLNREEGQYFELLSIIAAYGHRQDRRKLVNRATLLVSYLQYKLEPNVKAANSLVYWIDPLTSILRTMVDLEGFPKKDGKVPEWVHEHIGYPAMFGMSVKIRLERIKNTWKWFRKMGVVEYSKKKKRWVRSTPVFYSPGKITPEIEDIQSAILTFSQIDTYYHFIRETGSPAIQSDRLATFALPSEALELLDNLNRDYLFGEILEKLTYICNKDDMIRLSESDPAKHKEMVAYRKSLKEKGYKIPEAGDEDVDTLVQTLLAVRKATK